MDEIQLHGLRLMGTHGLLAEERARAQPFGIDVTLRLDLAPAAATDAIADTVDYGAVVAAVARIVEGEHCSLIERLAGRTAESLLALDPRIAEVVVRVAKLRPPVAHDLSQAAVQVTRARPS